MALTASADTSNPVSLVGIGASAGGLEACAELFSHVPADTGMAFVLVQHLDPRHESLLSELLGRRATIPVVEIVDGVRVQPNCVYVIPPNTSVTVTDGRLMLLPRDTSAGVRTPIDHFFQSLARTHGSMSVGIVLSGTGSDGTLGLEAIKAEGGLTFVQDEATAAFAGMPHSAIATGVIDFVGSPEEIGGQLGRLAGVLRISEVKRGPSTLTTDKLERILALLRTNTGVDFSGYKRSTVQRRVLRRMLLRRLDSLDDYSRIIEENAAEAQVLMNDLLIGVTSFFRDATVFDALERVVIPELLRERRRDSAVRVWVPGCASGEEPYSVAMCIMEAIGSAEVNPQFQIFATDLSDSVIAKARAALYPEAIEAEVSADRLGRFFVREKDGYRIAKVIRDRCIFARQNLVTDPPFSQLDLISCRNLLIYLDTPVQRKVLSLFHYALKPSGFLVLGSAESTGTETKLFTAVDEEHHIFRSTNQRVRTTRGIGQQSDATPALAKARLWEKGRLGQLPDQSSAAPTGAGLQDTPDLSSESNGRSRSLEEMMSDQAATNEALRAANEEIQSANEELQSTNEELETAKEEIQSANEELTTVNDELRVRNTELDQLNSDLHNLLGSINVPTLIVGADLRIRRFTPSLNRVMRFIPSDVGRPIGDLRLTVDLPDLEQLVLQTVDSLAATERQVRHEQGTWYIVRVCPYKTLDHRIDGAVVTFTDIDALKQHERLIEDARKWAEAIVETVREPLLILNANLRVRTANQAFYETFKCSPDETEGAYLFDLGDRQWDIPALRSCLEKVLTENASFEGFEVSHRFPRIGRRTLMLNGRKVELRDGPESLILLAMEDVTQQKLAGDREHYLVEASRFLAPLLDHRAILDGLAALLVPGLADWCAVDLVRDGKPERITVTHYDDERIEEARAIALESFGVEANPVFEVLQTGMPVVIEELVPEDLKTLAHSAEHLARLHALAPRSMLVFPIRSKSSPSGAVTLFTTVSGRHYTAADLPLVDGLGRWAGLALENADLLARVKAAHAATEFANRAKSQFLTAMSHDLRTPLNAIMGYVEVLEAGIHGGLSAAQSEDLRRIARSAHHLRELVSQVLNFARLEAGQLEYVMEDAPAGELIADAAMLVETQMKAKGLTFEVEECELDLIVNADPIKVQQILINLLSNAIKFTPAGGTIKLFCSGRPSAIAFSVLDTGPGIPRDQTRIVFEPFTQLNTGLTRTTEGLGLGLSISRELARKMGGDVSVESTVGEGSTFTLTLPAATGDASLRIHNIPE